MSCKSLLYLTSNQMVEIPDGGIVPVGNITRRFGNSIVVDGNTIMLREAGYYNISVVATFTASAAAKITMTVLENGVPLAGGSATETPAAIGDSVTMAIPNAVSRVYYGGGAKNITIVISPAADVTNSAITVEKV